MNLGVLRTHFKNLLNRSDITNSLADTFIDQSITRITRSLRVPAMEAQVSYSISASTTKIVLPNDFLEAIDLYYDSTLLTRLPMREMLNLKKSAQAGSPLYFSREQGNLLLYPSPTTGTVFLNYYAQFAQMTLDSDENILSKIASDLIIYGALVYAADYYFDERAGVFGEKYLKFMLELQEQANDAEMTGTLQAIRPLAYYD